MLSLLKQVRLIENEWNTWHFIEHRTMYMALQIGAVAMFSALLSSDVLSI